jgi:predicted RNA-binding Zn ribbon-like protein
MFKLDNQLLIELGLGGLPAEEKNRMLAHIYETLEMRVGMKLAEQMTDPQLDEFEGFIDRNDEAGALKWLETNFPNYKQVVADELEKLKGEIKASAPQILAASQQAQVAAAQQQPAQSSTPLDSPQQQPAQGYTPQQPVDITQLPPQQPPIAPAE